jgi:uncharacterized membrane protein YedE/YeeE
MLTRLHGNRRVQLSLGLLFGVVFGFLLQKGGVTEYDVIIGQLLLQDFTVVKVMLSAVVVGMLGINVLKSMKLIQFHPKPDSISAALIGGLIFGAGFALLGYCPGTLAGAAGSGYADALAGASGVVLGTVLFASVYRRIQGTLLNKWQLEKKTLPEILGVNRWIVVVPLAALIVTFLVWLEK